MLTLKLPTYEHWWGIETEVKLLPLFYFANFVDTPDWLSHKLSRILTPK